MKIIALISAYQEGNLLDSCIDSAKDLDKIWVFDGPIGTDRNRFINQPGISKHRMTPRHTQYERWRGEWRSDAEKRTDMLKKAQAWDEDCWILWLDGDELLLYGEYLKDHCHRADEETSTGGTTIRIVEYDGSVAKCYGKLIKAWAVTEYIMSSYEVQLRTGMTVALPNVPICSSGGIPIGEIKDRDDPILALNRPPLIGEPHLLHRHGLRNPKREAPRLHDKEAESFEQLVKDSNG